jgi:hypothetical protein
MRQRHMIAIAEIAMLAGVEFRNQANRTCNETFGAYSAVRRHKQWSNSKKLFTQALL